MSPRRIIFLAVALLASFATIFLGKAWLGADRTPAPAVPVAVQEKAATMVLVARGELGVGKILRAEPVASLYERKMVDHWGTFAALEDQMCSYTGEEEEESPDRLDAMVWSLTELCLVRKRTPLVGPVAMDSTNHWDMGSASGIVAESGPITGFGPH